MQEEKRNIKLVFPPFWTPTQPYLALPSLVAYMKMHNYEVEQVDYNLICYNEIFTKSFLQYCKACKKTENEELDEFIIENVEKMRADFSSSVCLDLYNYIHTKYFINLVFSYISECFENEEIDFYHYKCGYNVDNEYEIIEAVNNYFDSQGFNFFREIIERTVSKIYIKNNDVIGLSLTGLNQIIPTLIVAKELKRRYSNVKIFLGGNIPSRWMENITQMKFLFEDIDYIIINEGEVPLLQFAKYLNKEIGIDKVPNLFYKISDLQIKYTFNDCKHDINTYPVPIFNKEDLKKYFSPVPVLPLLSSRGCYWGKCAFCDHSYIYQNRYSKRKCSKIEEDLKTLREKYSVYYINYHDEAILPNEIREISKVISSNNWGIKWSCDARFDKNLDVSIIREAKESGLSVIFWGLESASFKILEAINKGIVISDVEKILNTTRQAGIWNHVFYFYGFPRESALDYQETIDFIDKNINNIHSSGCSQFSLGRYSKVAMEPEKYGVKLKENKRSRLALSLDYEENNVTIDIQKKKSSMKPQKNGCMENISKYVERDHFVIFSEKIIDRKQVKESFAKKFFLPGIFLWKNTIFDLENEKIIQLDNISTDIIGLLQRKEEEHIIIQKMTNKYGVKEKTIFTRIVNIENMFKKMKMLCWEEKYNV